MDNWTIFIVNKIKINICLPPPTTVNSLQTVNSNDTITNSTNEIFPQNIRTFWRTVSSLQDAPCMVMYLKSSTTQECASRYERVNVVKWITKKSIIIPYAYFIVFVEDLKIMKEKVFWLLHDVCYNLSSLHHGMLPVT